MAVHMFYASRIPTLTYLLLHLSLKLTPYLFPPHRAHVPTVPTVPNHARPLAHSPACLPSLPRHRQRRPRLPSRHRRLTTPTNESSPRYYYYLFSALLPSNHQLSPEQKKKANEESNTQPSPPSTTSPHWPQWRLRTTTAQHRTILVSSLTQSTNRQNISWHPQPSPRSEDSTFSTCSPSPSKSIRTTPPSRPRSLLFFFFHHRSFIPYPPRPTENGSGRIPTQPNRTTPAPKSAKMSRNSSYPTPPSTQG